MQPVRLPFEQEMYRCMATLFAGNINIMNAIVNDTNVNFIQPGVSTNLLQSIQAHHLGMQHLAGMIQEFQQQNQPEEEPSSIIKP